jgi:hypothetical protein
MLTQVYGENFCQKHMFLNSIRRFWKKGMTLSLTADLFFLPNNARWLSEIISILQRHQRTLFKRLSRNWSLKEPCRLSMEEVGLL